MFFLATADAEGRPNCSYKGGDPGFVRVLDETTIVFPNYDGNGMYLSARQCAHESARRPAVHRLRSAEAAAPERHRVDRAGDSASAGVSRGAVRGQGEGARGISELSALHPQVSARGALEVRAARAASRRRCRRWKQYEWAKDVLPEADPAREPEVGARESPETSAQRRPQPLTAPRRLRHVLRLRLLSRPASAPTPCTSRSRSRACPGRYCRGATRRLPCPWICMQFEQRLPGLYCGTLLGIDLLRVVHVAHGDRERILLVQMRWGALGGGFADQAGGGKRRKPDQGVLQQGATIVATVTHDRSSVAGDWLACGGRIIDTPLGQAPSVAGIDDLHARSGQRRQCNDGRRRCRLRRHTPSRRDGSRHPRTGRADRAGLRRACRSSADSVPSAFTPSDMRAIAAESRMQPWIRMPLQPLSTAFCASRSPSTARRVDPPASMTSTRPSPRSAIRSRTRELSSKHLIVATGPAKRARPP